MYIVKTRKCLSYLLNREAKRGRLLDLKNVPRQIGKTTLLARKAVWTSHTSNCECIIVEPTRNVADTMRREFSDQGINVTVKAVGELLSHNLYDANTMLSLLFIDEGLNTEDIKKLKALYTVKCGYTGHHVVNNYHERVVYHYKGEKELGSIHTPTGDCKLDYKPIWGVKFV